MKLTVNNKESEPSSPEEVAELLGRFSEETFLEIWLSTSPEEPALSILTNGDRAWLMFLRENGDSGFSSRNPDYAGPPEGTIEYFLSNGQRDEYPAAWAVSRLNAFRAAVFFAEKQERAPWIFWFED